MVFVGNAFRKAIFFGEHYVVHGSGALVAPIAPKTVVEIKKGGAIEGVEINSELGNDFFSSKVAGKNASLANMRAVYVEFLKTGKAVEIPLLARFGCEVSQKGTGMSASFAASFLLALCAAHGKRLSKDALFGIVQKGEEVAHGAAASGIDARVAIEGKPLLFRKRFSPVSYEFKVAKVALPSGARMLVCDTFAGVRSGTRRLVEEFAKSYGVEGEASASQRERIASEFEPILKKALENLNARGSIVELGSCMNANHGLLAAHGVSSVGIEKCREIAFAHGAFGAKLTGAGGEGGAVLVLCEEKAAARIIEGMKDAGFKAGEIRIAGK